MALAGNYAYIGARENGLRILNITNPATPTESGFYVTHNAQGVALAGNYAYIADLTGLRIINISNPALPTQAGSYNTASEVDDVEVAGNYAYLSSRQAGMRIINVTNPAAPTQVSVFDTPGWVDQVAIAGNYAYIADWNGGLRIANVSNPAAPTQVGYYNTPDYAHGVAVVGNYAYVAAAYKGLRIINVANPAAPTEVGFYDTPGFAEDVVVVGNYAYVADGYNGVRIVNIANPAAPTQAGHYVTSGYATRVAVAGNYIYVADWNGGLVILRFFESLEPFVKTADILFVPDRGGDDTSWFAYYYTDALEALGYSYDIWDTYWRGEIDQATLNQYTYGAVVWAVPDWGYVTDSWSSSQANLQSYLDNGGKLFISGQDIGHYAGGLTFYNDYLHAAFVQDGVNLYGLNGVSGDPISDGLYLAISGGNGANNQSWPSEIDPIAPAVSIFTYDPSAVTALAEPILTEEVRTRLEPGLEEPYPKRERKPKEPKEGVKLQGIVSSGTGAIRVDTGTYKVVYFAFGFEGINLPGDRQLVMERILDWTWSLPGDLDFNCVVNVADIMRVASRWRMTLKFCPKTGGVHFPRGSTYPRISPKNKGVALG